ncbi:hypothetical protein DITRI_Ditri15bG0026500 [Diplodiscus trichospermus]
MEVEPFRRKNRDSIEEQSGSSAASGLKMILAFTVFRLKRPVTTIHSVSLSNLKFSVDLARLQALLNASLNVDLSTKNPNKAGFKCTNSAAQLNLQWPAGRLEVPIPAGKISADET